MIGIAPSSPNAAALASQARKKRKVYANDEERKERRRLSNRLSAKRMRQQRSMAMSQIQEEVYRLRQMCQALHADNQQAVQEFHALQEENELMQMEIARLEGGGGHAPMSCSATLKGCATETGPVHDAPVSNLAAWNATKGKLYQSGKVHASSPQLQQLQSKPLALPERPRVLPPKGTMHITHSMTITPHARSTSSWTSASGTKTEHSSDVCSSRSLSGSGSETGMIPLMSRSPTLASLHHDNIVKKEQVYSPTLSTPTSWHHELSHPTIGVLQRPSGNSSHSSQRTSAPSFTSNAALEKQHVHIPTSAALPHNDCQMQSGLTAANIQMSTNLDSDVYPSAHSKSAPSTKMYYDLMACNEVLGLDAPPSNNQRSNAADPTSASQVLDMCKMEPCSPMGGSQDLSSAYWSDCLPPMDSSMLRSGTSANTHMDPSNWLMSR